MDNSKKNFRMIRSVLREDSGDFAHFHVDENEDMNFRNQLNRLVRRGVLKRVYPDLYVRNVK